MRYYVGYYISRPKQFARISRGNAWLVYEIAYNECKYEKRFLSMREINKAWGGKPKLFRRNAI